MKEIRLPLPDDMENTEKAFQLIKDLMSSHKEIEPTLWAGALFSVIADGYKNCGFSYEEFSEEVNTVLSHYRNYWD